MTKALVLSAVSLRLWCGRRRAAGLSPAMACGGAAAAARCERREEGEGGRGGQNGGNGLGAQADVPTRGGWRPAAARPTPAYGRHVAGAGWSKAGAARAGERGGGAGRAAQLGQKGGGSAQQRLPPFLFFFF
jgi:hypothetical protein